jgi:hypothetical protein
MYCVKIKDISGREVIVDVSYEVYQTFDIERKELERERYERRKHWDSRGLEDYIIGNDPIAVPETLEDWYFRRERMRTILKSFHSCTQLQQRRFTLFVDGKSYSEIARLQKCGKQSVRKSVESVISKIKKSLSE